MPRGQDRQRSGSHPHGPASSAASPLLPAAPQHLVSDDRLQTRSHIIQSQEGFLDGVQACNVCFFKQACFLIHLPDSSVDFSRLSEYVVHHRPRNARAGRGDREQHTLVSPPRLSENHRPCFRKIYKHLIEYLTLNKQQL